MPNRATYYIQYAGLAAVVASLGALLSRREIWTFAALLIGALLIWAGGFLRARKLL